MKLKFLATIVIFYCFGLLFSCLFTWLFNTNVVAIEFIKTPIFWLGPLLFVLLGLAIGALLLIVSKPKNRIRFLSYSLLISSLFFSITIPSLQLTNFYYFTTLTTIQSNN